MCILELGRVFGYARVSKPLTGDVRGRRSGVELCVQIGNPLLSELRIPYCVSAGETAAILLLYSPEKSRLQTGFTSISSAPSRVWSRLVAFSRAQFFFFVSGNVWACSGISCHMVSYLVVIFRHFSSFFVILRPKKNFRVWRATGGCSNGWAGRAAVCCAWLPRRGQDADNVMISDSNWYATAAGPRLRSFMFRTIVL